MWESVNVVFQCAQEKEDELGLDEYITLFLLQPALLFAKYIFSISLTLQKTYSVLLHG